MYMYVIDLFQFSSLSYSGKIPFWPVASDV